MFQAVQRVARHESAYETLCLYQQFYRAAFANHKSNLDRIRTCGAEITEICLDRQFQPRVFVMI